MASQEISVRIVAVGQARGWGWGECVCCLFGDFHHSVPVLMSLPRGHKAHRWSSAPVPDVEGAWAAPSLTSC